MPEKPKKSQSSDKLAEATKKAPMMKSKKNKGSKKAKNDNVANKKTSEVAPTLVRVENGVEESQRSCHQRDDGAREEGEEDDQLDDHHDHDNHNTDVTDGFSVEDAEGNIDTDDDDDEDTAIDSASTLAGCNSQRSQNSRGLRRRRSGSYDVKIEDEPPLDSPPRCRATASESSGSFDAGNAFFSTGASAAANASAVVIDGKEASKSGSTHSLVEAPFYSPETTVDHQVKQNARERVFWWKANAKGLLIRMCYDYRL